MPAQESKQVVLYAAKSTEDKRKSIPDQLADCRAMAGREGWEVLGEFQDEGFSAYSGNRGPGLEAAKAAAIEAAPAILLAQHSDRIARGEGASPDDADHLAEVVGWLTRNRILLRTVQDDFYADHRTAHIMAAAMGQRNSEDSRRKSAAVSAGMRRRRERGQHHGGPRPYGYEYSGGELVIVETEAAIVRRIFAEYAVGASQLGITKGLRNDGIPTIRGGEWYQGTIRTILSNPIYCGRIGDVPGEHEAIVDEATWTKAEQLRTAKSRTEGRGRPPAGQHLFRKGTLRCGRCGAAMVPRTSPNRAGKATETYRCYGRYLDVDSCSMHPVRREVVDGAVYHYFERVGLDLEATREQLAGEHDRKLSEVQALRLEAEREAQRVAESIARVRRDYTEGKLGAEDWAGFRDELADDLKAAEAEAERLQASEAEAEKGSAMLDAEQAVLERLSEIRRVVAGEIKDVAGVEAVRAAFSRLFSQFILHPAENPRLGRRSRDEPEPWPDRPAQAPLLDVDEYRIEVWVRPQALTGDFETVTRPALHREPLRVGGETITASAWSERNSSALPGLFGPIPVKVPA